jgi:hypothetical protein
MVTDRLMEQSQEGESPTFDETLLGISLAEDEHHFETPVSFFKQAGTVTKVYEGEDHQPICFARAAKSLRIDIHFLDNSDKRKNATALAEGIGPLVEQAKASGFYEIVFTTSNPELAAFCEKKLGYEVVPDKFVLRKFL